MSEFGEYKNEIMDAANNERIELAISRAMASFRSNINSAITKFPHTVKLAEEVRDIKLRSLMEMEKLAHIACEAIEANKGKAYIAKNGKDAIGIIQKLVGKNKLIVKGKSITAHEIELQENLESWGNEVYETDLGEFIVQKLHSKPMHILSPAIHVPKEDVAALLSKLSGKDLPPTDIEQMVATARELLRDKFIRADIGFSGSNVVAADVGSIFLIENEGNIRLATTLPPIHIAIVGMDKLVPSLSDAFKVVEVAWRYANYTVPSYLSMTSGPSKTGDIEKVTTYGAHGPKEFHVIFLDNGRIELAKNPILREAMLCLGCGGCLYECPVFAVTAGHFGDSRFAGAGAVWAALRGKTEKAAAIAYTCLTCGRCKVRCPMSIDTPSMCIELRRLIAENKCNLNPSI
jgi:L-lactate dehydrogenase complex protein LldG